MNDFNAESARLLTEKNKTNNPNNPNNKKAYKKYNDRLEDELEGYFMYVMYGIKKEATAGKNSYKFVFECEEFDNTKLKGDICRSQYHDIDCVCGDKTLKPWLDLCHKQVHRIDCECELSKKDIIDKLTPMLISKGFKVSSIKYLHSNDKYGYRSIGW